MEVVEMRGTYCNTVSTLYDKIGTIIGIFSTTVFKQVDPKKNQTLASDIIIINILLSPGLVVGISSLILSLTKSNPWPQVLIRIKFSRSLLSPKNTFSAA